MRSDWNSKCNFGQKINWITNYIAIKTNIYSIINKRWIYYTEIKHDFFYGSTVVRKNSGNNIRSKPFILIRCHPHLPGYHMFSNKFEAVTLPHFYVGLSLKHFWVAWGPWCNKYTNFYSHHWIHNIFDRKTQLNKWKKKCWL